MSFMFRLARFAPVFLDLPAAAQSSRGALDSGYKAGTATLVVVPVHERRPAVLGVVHLHQRRDVLPTAGGVADALDG